MKKYILAIICICTSWQITFACVPVGQETVMMGRYAGGEGDILRIAGVQSVYSEYELNEFTLPNAFFKNNFSTHSNRDIYDLQKGNIVVFSASKGGSYWGWDFGIIDIAQVSCDKNGNIQIQKLEKKTRVYSFCNPDLLDKYLGEELSQRYDGCANINYIIDRNILISEYGILLFFCGIVGVALLFKYRKITCKK